MLKFAIVLSGCGVFDGSEIHEAVLTMLAIDRTGIDYEIFAPNIDQHHVIDHYTGQTSTEKRNVLHESARIARGKIKPLSEIKSQNFDGIVFPGGFGVAKNLCDYALMGENCSVLKEIDQLVKDFHSEKKPIGGLCIAPVMLTRILGNINVTIGNHPETIASIESFGGKHVNSTHGNAIVDKTNKIITIPCYMLEARINEIFEDTSALISAMKNLC